MKKDKNQCFLHQSSLQCNNFLVIIIDIASFLVIIKSTGGDFHEFRIQNKGTMRAIKDIAF